MRSLDYETRTLLEAERRERILALPTFTLMRLGWEIEPGRVQGGIFYRIGKGLGPSDRDSSAVDVLYRQVQRSHMPHEHQQWGIEILARPGGSQETR